MYLVFADEDGNVDDEFYFGGPLDQQASSVAPVSGGGYVLAGYTNTASNGADMCLVKVTAAGVQDWLQPYGGTSDERAGAAQQTIDGGYALFGSIMPNGTNGYDMQLVKVQVNGLKDWSGEYGGTGDERAYDGFQTSDYGYVLAGYTTSTAGGHSDMYLVKTLSTGVEDWSEAYGGLGEEEASDVEPTSDGGYILVGSTAPAGGGDLDVYVVKTDSDGGFDWDATLGGGVDDVALCVRQTSDGGYIVGGGTQSSGAGAYDMYLIKLRSNGSVAWSRTFGGLGDEAVYDVRQTSDGGYILIGGSNSFPIGERVKMYVVKTDGRGIGSSAPNVP
jgi:hypothetical protein